MLFSIAIASSNNTLVTDTMGRFWGPAYQTWEDPSVNECDLLGITCASGKIARIDLSGAEMCSNGDRRPGPVQYCMGLPKEIGLLTSLEVLLLKRRQYLRGSLPTEIGQLSLLRYLDLSTCSSMTSTIPTEIGLLTNLKHLFMPHSYFHGAIPTEIYRLSNLEKLYLTNNRLEGSLSSLISGLSSMKELRISRNFLTGSFPIELSQLEKLENLEAYHNSLTGSLPSVGPSLKRIGTCLRVRRLDSNLHRFQMYSATSLVGASHSRWGM
jgi:Leucine rich repeat